MANEWSAVDRRELTVPAELRAIQRYRFTSPAPIGLTGSCAEWVYVQGGVTLRDALLDTSQRVHGTVLEWRITHRREVTIIGAPVVVFPMSDDEAAAAVPDEGR